jgi:hypothetical protein
MLKNDELEKILNRVHEWIRSADQKISIFLAFEGILVTLLAPSLMGWLRFAVRACRPFSFLLLCVGTGLIFYSFYKMIFEALMPRVSHALTARSVLFFGDIASFKLLEYQKRVEEINDDEMKTDFVSQIHVSSVIASAKHAKFKEAVTMTSIGFGLIIVGWLALIFGSYGR